MNNSDENNLLQSHEDISASVDLEDCDDNQDNNLIYDFDNDTDSTNEAVDEDQGNCVSPDTSNDPYLTDVDHAKSPSIRCRTYSELDKCPYSLRKQTTVPFRFRQ